MSILMIIMTVLSSLLVSVIFGFNRYRIQGALAIDKSFIFLIGIICVVIGAIISGIDALIDMMNYH